MMEGVKRRFASLPTNAIEFLEWPWKQIEPYYDDLLVRKLTLETMPQWLADWSHLQALVLEALARLDRATGSNTADQKAQTRRHEFFTAVCQPAWANDEKLFERWRECGLSVPGYEKALARLQTERAFVYEANQPLEAQE